MKTNMKWTYVIKDEDFKGDVEGKSERFSYILISLNRLIMSNVKHLDRFGFLHFNISFNHLYYRTVWWNNKSVECDPEQSHGFPHSGHHWSGCHNEETSDRYFWELLNLSWVYFTLPLKSCESEGLIPCVFFAKVQLMMWNCWTDHLTFVLVIYVAQNEEHNPSERNLGSDDLNYAALSILPNPKRNRRPASESKLESNVVYAATR